MKVSRLVSIIMVLIDKKKISAKELSDMFEVSTRTIYRDIEAISMSGIPVHSTSGIGGGFQIMDNFKIDKNTFSESDITTILIGISNIPNIMKNKEFPSTLAKINNFIPKDKIESAQIKTDQMHVDFDHWMGVRNLDHQLNIIKYAIQNNNVISFEYINHKGEKTKRQVEPYQIIFKSSQWYFHGYCYERSDFRLFKLTRLSNLKLIETAFIPKDYKKILLDTTNIVTKLQVDIKLRIHVSIMERLLDYCEPASFIPDSNDYYIVNFPFIENDYYYGIILSFGGQCECLEPLHIRSELKRKIESLSQMYKV
ncbi:helix-turn-helix transcriptional regulator (plasmid) [Latilactobacillus sp. 5-91]|uniref:helix-turn-helix transcriptional regulator n=1 Tax=Latilactobacillus sp. 5-91 TaxID=3410924 RepID=UPI003C74A932